MKKTHSQEFQGLLDVMKRLRGPKGCPWDREQTKGTLKWYLVEECYEVLDAIETKSSEKLKEELGDVLFQIIFLAEIAEEECGFNIVDVISSARDKMIRRHPHVFHEKTAKDSMEVKKIWWDIKKKENRKEEGSIFDSIPQALPSLLRALSVIKRTAHDGFKWNTMEKVFDTLKEKTTDLEDSFQNKNKEKAEEKVGNLLFHIVQLSRFLEVNPEEALRKIIIKFMAQFKESGKS